MPGLCNVLDAILPAILLRTCLPPVIDEELERGRKQNSGKLEGLVIEAC